MSSEAEDEDLVARAHARVGSTFGAKYRIDRVLGIGGMAVVYAAEHRNGHRVALKVLNPELSIRADIRARFRREGQTANALHHPGAVVVIDDDVGEDGSAFLVMELLEGEVVERLWERAGRRLPVDVVLAIARELCAVLAAAHRVGVVHRDLKPENLFVTTENRLKVLDFGLAQLRDAARPKDSYTGMVFGTPAFMPPEQAAGRTSQIDARTDLWAVGATMFTLLSGEVVHSGESAQEMVVKSASEPARSLGLVVPDAPSELVVLVDRALTWDRDLRWPDAEAMREAIRATSAAICGNADVPLLVPAALVTPSDPAVPSTKRDPVAPIELVEETTRIGHRPLSLLGEAEDEMTSVQHTSQPALAAAPPAPALEAPDAPTQTRRAVAIGSGDEDGPDSRTERRQAPAAAKAAGAIGASQEDTQTTRRPPAADSAPEPPPGRAPSGTGWSDLRQVIEDGGRRSSGAQPAAKPAPFHEVTTVLPSLAGRQEERTTVMDNVRASQSMPAFRPQHPSHPHLVPAPPPPRPPQLEPQPPTSPTPTTIMYIAIVVAVLAVCSLPLVFLLARGCGNAPPSMPPPAASTPR